MKPDTQNRLELLKKYYAYDEANKTFNVVLRYEKVSDILYREVKSISNVPLMNEEFLNDVTGILEDIPKGYYADISLRIDDYEGYDEKVIMESFNDMLEFGRLKYNSGSRKKYFKVATLLTVGLVLLFFGIFVEVNEWWHIFDTEPLIIKLITSFIEIAGWVFAWEAVSILFLEENEDMKKGSAIISKLNRIGLYSKDNKNVLISEEYEQIQEHFFRSSPLRRAGSLLLIFSGFAYIGLASMVAIRALSSFTIGFNIVALFIIILNWLWVILMIIGGVFAVKLYTGKEKYRIPAAVFAAINFAFLVTSLVISFINGIDISLVVVNIVSAVFEIAYLLGFFFTLDYKKKAE